MSNPRFWVLQWGQDTLFHTPFLSLPITPLYFCMTVNLNERSCKFYLYLVLTTSNCFLCYPQDVVAACEIVNCTSVEVQCMVILESAFLFNISFWCKLLVSSNDVNSRHIVRWTMPFSVSMCFILIIERVYARNISCCRFCVACNTGSYSFLLLRGNEWSSMSCPLSCFTWIFPLI